MDQSNTYVKFKVKVKQLKLNTRVILYYKHWCVRGLEACQKKCSPSFTLLCQNVEYYRSIEHLCQFLFTFWAKWRVLRPHRTIPTLTSSLSKAAHTRSIILCNLNVNALIWQLLNWPCMGEIEDLRSCIEWIKLCLIFYSATLFDCTINWSSVATVNYIVQ